MRLSIRFKLMGAVVAGLLVVSAVAAGLLRFVYERASRLAAEASIRNAAAAFANLEKNESDKLAVALEALAANPEVRRLFAARDREGLLRATVPLFRELRDRHHVTHCYFHLPDRTVFLRVHAPGLHGDAVARPSLLRAAETGELTAGKDLGKTAFALRVILPWRVAGQVVGYLELGQEVDQFLAELKAQTGDDYALFVEKSNLDPQAWAEQKARGGERSGWDDHPALVRVESTAPLAWPDRVARLAHEISPSGEAVEGDSPLDAEHVTGLFSTRDGSGRPVGAVLVRHDMHAMRAGLAEVRGRVVLTIALLAAGLGALIAFLLDTLVFDRLRRMSELLEQLPERMARGEYRVQDAVVPPPDDEIGRFERLFQRAVEVIGGALREIEHARGSRDADGPHDRRDAAGG